MAFNAAVEADRVVTFIKDYMDKNGPNAPIVIGISGGKDSAAVAAASVAAVGPNRVLGVLLPAGVQKDIQVAEDCCRFLKIRRIVMNIGTIIRDSYDIMKMGAQNIREFYQVDPITAYNHPSRIRTAMLYMIANQVGGRVANTSNLSETYVGYDTKWGDQCGDFSPFIDYTASEIIEIGIALGMPEKAMRKAPDDGMCGQTDEERWGFTYGTLDKYLRGGVITEDTIEKIERMHRRAAHKYNIVLPHCEYKPEGTLDLFHFPALPSWLKAQAAKTTPEDAQSIKQALKENPELEAKLPPPGYVYDIEHDRYVRMPT